MQSVPDEGLENVYIYTFADVYTSVICLYTQHMYIYVCVYI